MAVGNFVMLSLGDIGVNFLTLIMVRVLYNNNNNRRDRSYRANSKGFAFLQSQENIFMNRVRREYLVWLTKENMINRKIYGKVGFCTLRKILCASFIYNDCLQ